jgi:hypothetical protein
LCRALRRHVRLQRYLDLNLNLNTVLFQALDCALFEKSFQQLFLKSFAVLFE